MRVTPGHDHDENGSMIIALTVMMVLALLTLGVLARTLSGMSSARRHQDFNAALGNADAGLSDALFRIDQTGTGSLNNACLPAGTTCTVASVPGAPGVSYTMNVLDSRTVRVRAKGLVNGVPHAVEAYASRDLAFPFAIFGTSSLTFNGNDNGNIYTIDESGNHNPAGGPSANAGTNGSITCNGGSPAAQHHAYSGGSVNGCNPAGTVSGSYNPLPPATSCPTPTNTPSTPCLPASYLPCPAVSGTLPVALAPGVYYCTSSVAFPNGFTVNGSVGTVELFVIPSSGDANVSIDGADVNVGGDPTRLRVYLGGNGDIIAGTGSHAGAFTGIMWAPNADMTSNGCKVDWRGALIFKTATCNGGPQLNIAYDTRVAALVDKNWHIENYTEMPSQSFGTP